MSASTSAFVCKILHFDYHTWLSSFENSLFPSHERRLYRKESSKIEHLSARKPHNNMSARITVRLTDIEVGTQTQGLMQLLWCIKR